MLFLFLVACRTADPDPASKPAPTEADVDTDTDADSDSDTPGDTYAGGETGTPPLLGVLQFSGKRPKNLLMISVDTFRKDHLNRYGGPGITPALDALMNESVVLDAHTQCSNWTFPSTSCTLLGRYHEDNGHIPQLSTNGRAPFPDGLPFLARQLGDAGFHTVIASRNSWLSAEWNATQGYDVEVPRQGGSFTTSLEAALPEIRGTKEPWFLHVHTTEPHVPYDPPDEYLADLVGLDPIPWDLTVTEAHYDAQDAWPTMDAAMQALVLQHMQIRYRGEIQWLDTQIGAALSSLEVEGLLADTLVVVWNDHGEQWWEHGNLTHAHDLYREENDAFLFFWGKTLVPTSWTGPTTSVDMVPTLLNVFDVPTQEWSSGEIAGTFSPDRPRFALSVAREGLVASVTRGSDRLIFYGRTGLRHRFDLVADPLEAVDLFDAEGAVDVELWDLLKPRVDATLAAAPDVVVVYP
jgi:choline-sulfatase